VVMATTTAASPMPGSLETLEETVQIAATLENGSLPSGRRNLEAVFFDLDDTLVLTHAADTVAHKAVQALVQQRIPLVNGDEMLKVFIAKFDVQPWDLTHQVGYLSLSSPSVCAIFYNSENMNVLGIRIVNPRFYFIPRVIMCTYMLIISFMVLAALESRAFCCCIRSL
jgi:hypothetical protein